MCCAVRTVSGKHINAPAIDADTESNAPPSEGASCHKKMKSPAHEKTLLTQVLHPSADDYIDADRYLGEFGADATGKRRARCPLCLRHAMEPVVEGGRALGFSHRERATASACPLVTCSTQPSKLRMDHARNIAWHRQHRSAFLAQWQMHYRRMKEQVGSLTVDRLVSLIAYADVVNLWSHPALVLVDVPYVLLALGELFAEPGDPAAAYWVRFVFDGTVRCVDDLWRARSVAPRLYKISYKTETVGHMPVWRDIVSCDDVPFGATKVTLEARQDIRPHAARESASDEAWVPVAEAARVESFIRSGDGLGLVEDPKPEESAPPWEDRQTQVLESLENYAVYTMRAYARRRGRSG